MSAEKLSKAGNGDSNADSTCGGVSSTLLDDPTSVSSISNCMPMANAVNGFSSSSDNDGTLPLANPSLSNSSSSAAAASTTGALLDSMIGYNSATGMAAGSGLGMAPFSSFPSAADGSWTPTYDPGLFNTFGFPGGALMPQNQFFFAGGGGDPGVWSDPLLVNSAAAAANNWLLGAPASLPMDQTQLGVGTGLPLDSAAGGLGTGLAGAAADPMATLGQSFGGITLNGGGGTSLQSVIPSMAAPTILPGIQNQPGFPATAVPDVVSNQSTVVAPPPPTTTAPEKPKSWAAIASQPAKPKPPPPKPHPLTETSERSKPPTNFSRAAANQSSGLKGSMASVVSSSGGGGSSSGRGGGGGGSRRPVAAGNGKAGSVPEVVNKLQSENRYNPSDFSLPLNNARYFVIKSYAEDDVHRSIKYSVWCSTEHGNRRLDSAYKDQAGRGGAIYLFFSVNGSGHFCGVAQMASEVQFNEDTGIWTQDKWRGRFEIKWIYVKDVPNNQLRHIRLENNENKPVTNSRDTQEVPPDKGRQVMKIIHTYQHTTSIFDDFEHYEKRQEEDAGSAAAVASTGGKK